MSYLDIHQMTVPRVRYKQHLRLSLLRFCRS